MAKKAKGKTDKPISKSQLVAGLAESTGLSKKQTQGVLDALNDAVARELTKGAGVFTLPGLLKLKVVRKPAQPERKGRNPFTGEETVFKAKPARNVVKAIPVKALKDKVS
jgi:nucleoid DNA-binding protein